MSIRVAPRPDACHGRGAFSAVVRPMLQQVDFEVEFAACRKSILKSWRALRKVSPSWGPKSIFIFSGGGAAGRPLVLTKCRGLVLLCGPCRKPPRPPTGEEEGSLLVTPQVRGAANKVGVEVAPDFVGHNQSRGRRMFW